MYKYLLFLLLIASKPSLSSEKYKSKSLLEPVDYKCKVHEAGGYISSDYSHEFTRFKAGQEIRLMHIRNIPEKLLRKIYKEDLFGSEDERLGTMYKELEYSLYKKQDYSEFDSIKSGKHEYISETGSYFMIPYGMELNDLDHQGLLMQACNASGFMPSISISCDPPLEAFILSYETMRFTYSTSGRWHSGGEEEYSTIQFGTCEKV